MRKITYARLGPSRAQRRHLTGRSEAAELRLKDQELRYAKLQTIFAGLGVAVSAFLSATGLWIAVQLSEANSRDQAAEFEMSRQARLEDKARRDVQACLQLALQARQADPATPLDSDAMTIRREIERECNRARINLRDQRLRDADFNRQVLLLLLRAIDSPAERTAVNGNTTGPSR